MSPVVSKWLIPALALVLGLGCAQTSQSKQAPTGPVKSPFRAQHNSSSQPPETPAQIDVEGWRFYPCPQQPWPIRDYYQWDLEQGHYGFYPAWLE